MLHLRPQLGPSLALASSVVLLSCTGNINGPAADRPLEPGVSGAPPSGAEAGQNAGGPMLSNEAALHCEPAATTFAPKRLWRLTGAQYRSTVQAALPLEVSSSPFDAGNAADRFSNLSDSYTMNDFELRQSMDQSESLSLAAVAAWRKDPTSCLQAAPFADCAASLLETTARKLLRRPLSTEDAQYYRSLVVDNAAQLGEDDALALAVQRLLVSVYFVFRTELGRGNVDRAGVVSLSSHEVAEAIAYSLTDAPPDAELAAAADAGELAKPEQIKAHVVRLLASVAEIPSTTRFFRELTYYPRARDVFKDAADFPFHRAADLVDDTDRWLRSLLGDNGRSGFLKALLTAPSAFVRRDSAPSYANLDDGSTPSVGNEPELFQFPPGQRAGILTQPSFLVAFSKSTENEAVKRGRFMVETLLCGTVPEVPIGLVPTLPETPDATMRERLAVHRSAKANCPTCHTQMDPLGLSLESYDHLGRFRSTEFGKPIDASGELTGAGSADGHFADAADLGSRLAASEVVAQCFVRHSFRYWMGRNETAGDGCTMKSSYEAFSANSENYVELLTALFTSEAFLERSTATGGTFP